MKQKKLHISENCISEKLDNELIILDLESGLYHSLNKLGSIIWHEIKDKNPSYQMLKNSMLQKYTGENIVEDFDLFLKELEEKKMIFLQ
tara:strand:+ start:2823 stop:3089 length:267 start_codon:yes stop_codon:yes gene_type:complete